jgi:hypothetical protein
VPEIRAIRADPLPAAERPALGFRDLHIHLDLADREAVRIIVSALSGQAGEAITKGEPK